MSEYSKAKVDRWLKTFATYVEHANVVQLTAEWLGNVVSNVHHQKHEAHQAKGGACTCAAQDQLIVELNEMSLWEQANVFFGLISLMEMCASEAAKQMATSARKADSENAPKGN